MEGDSLANQYQVLEELGSKLTGMRLGNHYSHWIEGGSFGVVYKAIERATGEVVAIKHVSLSLSIAPCNGIDNLHRSISNRVKMIYKKYSKRYRYSVPVQVLSSLNTKPAS